MIEIPPNALMARLEELDWQEEVPDEWKTIPALTEEQAKIYRTKGVILTFVGQLKFCALKVEGIIPVYSDGRVIGCLGEVVTEGESVVAEMILDYSTPERLEIQNGDSLWAEPVLKVITAVTGFDITEAQLTGVKVVKGTPSFIHEPIGKV
jgi:hypothetical protein